MPDDQKPDELLSKEEYNELRDIAASLPAGHPAQKKVSALLSSQKTPFERERPGGGVTAGGIARGVGTGLKNLASGAVSALDPTSGLSGAALTAIGVNPREGTVSERLHEIPIVHAAHEIISAHHDPTAKKWEAPVAGAGALVGVSAEQAREHAKRGEGGEIVGEAAVPAAAAVLPSIASRVAPRLSRIGSAETGTTSPITRLILGHRIGALMDLLSKEVPTEKIPAIQRQAEVTPIARTPQPAAAAPKAAPAAPKPIETPATGPQKLPTQFQKGTRPTVLKMEDLVNEAAGVKPLRPDVPLKEQLTSAAKPAASIEEIDPVKAKYPDPAVRQMVRANGEAIYEATKHDPMLVKKIHDLTRVDLRQALVNAGEEMGQQTVSNSKFAGEGSIAREEAFNRLLKKGLTPERIIELAKYKPSEKAAELSEPRKSLGPEFEAQQRSHELERNKSILRNPRATAEDRRIAQSRLDEMNETEEEGLVPSMKLTAQRAARERAARIREARQ